MITIKVGFSVAVVVISYCCYLVNSTFNDLQHALSVEEVNNEQ